MSRFLRDIMNKPPGNNVPSIAQPEELQNQTDSNGGKLQNNVISIRPSTEKTAEISKQNSGNENQNSLTPSNPTPPHPTAPQQTQPHPTQNTIKSDKTELPVSPTKDFTKVANSIAREAVPLGLFKGTSKHTYDVLYQKTRGAIVPQRRVKLRKSELMKLAGISDNTLQKHLFHLKEVGLIVIDYELGDNNGSVYEVFMPEELDSLGTSPTQPNPTQPQATPPQLSQPQKVGYPQPQKMGLGGVSKLSKNKDTSADAKTLIKTKEEKRIDDEPAAAFRSFSEKLNQGFKELTGREAAPSDEAKLAQLGELITAELLEAASRTKVVSDPAAFLLTHMRRRLGVRSVKVETLGEKETGKGTASTKTTKREIQLTDDEIQECPDCQGRLLVYPEGPGKGAVMCKHESLIKAKQESANKEKK